jgi:hypothetical protein
MNIASAIAFDTAGVFPSGTSEAIFQSRINAVSKTAFKVTDRHMPLMRRGENFFPKCEVLHTRSAASVVPSHSWMEADHANQH